MPAKPTGDVQGANGPELIEHSKLPPGSPEMTMEALLVVVLAAGTPVSEGVPGAAVSTVQVAVPDDPRLPLDGSK
jgi:hypothetical protein